MPWCRNFHFLMGGGEFLKTLYTCFLDVLQGKIKVFLKVSWDIYSESRRHQNSTKTKQEPGPSVQDKTVSQGIYTHHTLPPLPPVQSVTEDL